MSDKTNGYLAIINSGLWPAELPRYEWQGTLDETWRRYIGDNKCDDVLTKLANRTIKEKRKKEPDVYFGNYIYMWRFEVLGRVYHKVGVTHDLHQRFKSFRHGIPERVMTNCAIFRITPVQHRVTALQRETAFIIAARDYWVGGEWFEFPDAVLNSPVAELA